MIKLKNILLESSIFNNKQREDFIEILQNTVDDEDLSILDEMSAEEYVDNTIEKLSDIKKQGKITLYRIIWTKNIDDIDKSDLGIHWVMNLEDFNEVMIDWLYQNAREKDEEFDEYDDCYLITAETSPSNIDYFETMLTQMEHPFEEEIWLKTGKNMTIKDIGKFYD